MGGEPWKIEYLYTADGRKVRKTAPYLDGNVNGGVGARVMEYLDGFHYQDGTLRFFPTAEGYVEVTQTKDGESYSYVFNYTDHLGNIRLSYAEDPQSPWSLRILEENHYYPFGLKHTNYNSDMLAFREGGQGLALLAPQASPVPQFPYNYKYNGKELQDEMGMNIYDYGTRNYDPAIGRWMNIDPLAEQGRRWSPYAYAFDNPVYFIDPDGRWPWPVIKALASVANDKWDKAWKKSYNRKTYNHDIAKAPIYFVADILENANTYKRKKIEISNKDINSTATSKNGGGENQKSKGKKKGDNIDADAFLTAAPGAEKTGNNLKNIKELLEAGNDIKGIFEKGMQVGDGVNGVIDENKGKKDKSSEYVIVVHDPNNSNNDVQVRRDVYESQQKKKEEK